MSAVITSAGYFDLIGTNITHFVHMSTMVKTYLNPSGEVLPGEYKSMARTWNGWEHSIGVSGVLSSSITVLARLHLTQALMYLVTSFLIPRK